jgi:predicted DNA-binding transcriptional regulator
MELKNLSQKVLLWRNIVWGGWVGFAEEDRTSN